MATVQMACRAAMAGGRARCRNMNCAVHGPDAPKAPRPDVVLVKFNLNEALDKAFDLAGVHDHNRTIERGNELGAQHEAQAKALGRDATHIREVRGENVAQLAKPEAADSGSPVFGIKGLLGGVNLTEVRAELEAAGLRLTSYQRLKRAWKEGDRGPASRLTLEFRKDKEPAEGFPWELLQNEILAFALGKLDLWANPRDHRGLIVHTLNAGGEKKPLSTAQHTLHFAEGDWDVA